MDAPMRGKNTARRTTAWRLAAVSCLLLVFVFLLLISTTTTTVESSRQGITSSQRGSEEFGSWRKDVVRPDRTTDARAPPAPMANSNVPGGPFGG